MAYTYINGDESIGSSVNTLLKGFAQLATSILNAALNPSNGVPDLGAIAIVLFFVALVIAGVAAVILGGKKIFHM